MKYETQVGVFLDTHLIEVTYRRKGAWFWRLEGLYFDLASADRAERKLRKRLKRA